MKKETLQAIREELLLLYVEENKDNLIIVKRDNDYLKGGELDHEA
jgi:hypothetical protein